MGFIYCLCAYDIECVNVSGWRDSVPTLTRKWWRGGRVFSATWGDRGWGIVYYFVSNKVVENLFGTFLCKRISCLNLICIKVWVLAFVSGSGNWWWGERKWAPGRRGRGGLGCVRLIAQQTTTLFILIYPFTVNLTLTDLKLLKFNIPSFWFFSLIDLFYVQDYKTFGSKPKHHPPISFCQEKCFHFEYSSVFLVCCYHWGFSCLITL